MALLTGVLMVWLAMLPDIDHRLPAIEHRGATHSLLFACVVGCGFAAVGWLLADMFTVAGISPPVFGFLLGFLIVGAHLVGDMLTYAGVNYFWPWKRTFSLSLTEANSTVANYGLLAGGVGVTLLWVAVAVGG